MRMKQTWTALRALLIFTVVLGVGYPLLITGIGQLALPAQANGSLVSSDGAVVGSALIGQAFTDADGTALPEWFQSRPSAAGAGYDGGASSGSNYGPENPDLISAIQNRRSAIESLESVTVAEIPVDALTASASGLDPHISPAAAFYQVRRVARQRGLPEAELRQLVSQHVEGRQFGVLGEPVVNVLLLNLALDERAPRTR